MSLPSPLSPLSLYLDPELITDETASAEAVLAAIADHLNVKLGLAGDDEWQPMDGSPETSIAEAVGIVLATAMSLIQDQERNDFAEFGDLILNTRRGSAEPAQVTGRWTFATGGQHFIPDGSETVIDTATNEPVAFATLGDVTFTGTEVDIPMVAVEPGAITNGLTGLTREWEAIPYVSAVTFIGTSAGGADEEERDAYLEKIVRRARRMKLVPTVTDDYADTAIDHPSVDRAVAVRLLDADNPTDPPSTPGHVTVYVVGAAGANLSAQIKGEVLESMTAEDRPLSVTPHIEDPTRTDVTIAVSVRLTVGADEDATVAAIQAAIELAYSEANYGRDLTAPGRWRAPRSVAERTINAYDVAASIDDLLGIAKIETVTVNGGSSVTLNGWAPLPNLTGPATVTVL